MSCPPPHPPLSPAPALLPCLHHHQVGAPGGTCAEIISCGAYVTPAMMEAEYSMLEKQQSCMTTWYAALPWPLPAALSTALSLPFLGLSLAFPWPFLGLPLPFPLSFSHCLPPLP